MHVLKAGHIPLRTFASQLFIFFLHLGGLGLLSLGVLDSSFMFLPFGNDILMVAMTARRHLLMPYFAVMATGGSVIGCALVDVVCREGGERGLERHASRRRLDYVKKRFKKSADWALAFASLMPPPFPFTPFVMVASALQYPRKRLLSVIAVARFIRFLIEGILAILFGRRILRLAYSSKLEDALIVLIVVSIAGSAFSIYSWIQQSKSMAHARM